LISQLPQFRRCIFSIFKVSIFYLYFVFLYFCIFVFLYFCIFVFLHFCIFPSKFPSLSRLAFYINKYYSEQNIRVETYIKTKRPSFNQIDLKKESKKDVGICSS